MEPLINILFFLLIVTYFLVSALRRKTRLPSRLNIEHAAIEIYKKQKTVADAEHANDNIEIVDNRPDAIANASGTKPDSLLQTRNLSNETQDVATLRSQCYKIIYGIGVGGISGSGKSAILSKIVNQDPNEKSTDKAYFDLEAISSSDFVTKERIERTFRFYEWDGTSSRDILRAAYEAASEPEMQAENGAIFKRGINALLLVMDTARPDSVTNEQTFSPERIQEQITGIYSKSALGFILNDTILSRTRTVIIFINKADCFHGAYSELEGYCEEFIDKVKDYIGKDIKLHVIVGSAAQNVGIDDLLKILRNELFDPGRHNLSP